MSCTISCNESCRYPCNFIYKVVPMTATMYPKIKNLTLKLPIKSKIFNLSYNFDYICLCETSLVLMEVSILTYKIHCS